MMMTRRQASAGMLASAARAAGPATAMAQEPKARQLPPPHQDDGMPLMGALKQRHSKRGYLNRPLAAQTLSDLLWAAFGINRPSGDRTAPYWRHVMVIDGGPRVRIHLPPGESPQTIGSAGDFTRLIPNRPYTIED
jgi:hypothetical protein